MDNKEMHWETTVAVALSSPGPPLFFRRTDRLVTCAGPIGFVAVRILNSLAMKEPTANNACHG